MGTLEKAGILVVAGLIGVIGIVGFINRDTKEASKEEQVAEESTKKKDAAKRRGDRGRRPADLSRRKGDVPVKKPAGKTPDPTPKKGEDDAGKATAGNTRTPTTPPTRPGDRPGKVVTGSDVVKGTPPAKPKKDEPKVEIPTPQGVFPRDYVVKPGEVLSKIAYREYGTTRMVAAIEAANPGLRRDAIREGQTIELPKPDADILAAAKRSREGATRRPGDVRPASVSSRAPITRPSFITSTYLKNQGRLISQRGRASARRAAGGGGTYTVKKNDTLSSIAQRELGSVRHVGALLRANRDKIKNPDRLREGWVLTLPSVN